ncbi:MAG: DUF4493 domain-containing protein [Bacteroidales bacterium]|nr:DUF4493 domain-containing protein [Bacteroidales bacterium]
MLLNLCRIKKIPLLVELLAFLASGFFVSCAQLEDEQSAAEGYLRISGLYVDVSVEEAMPTKAMALPEISAPEVSELSISVINTRTGAVAYEGTGLWSDNLTLPVGTYEVMASYGSNAFGEPFFCGTANVNVGALEQKTVSLSVMLANALVAVTVAPDMSEHFTVESVLLSDGQTSFEVSSSDWCYVPVGNTLVLTLDGKNSAGKDAEVSYSLENPLARTAYEVVCGKSTSNWPVITMPSLAEGAFEGGLYFAPASLTNISAENSEQIVYQIKGGDYSDWTRVDVSDVEGYKFISGLSNDVTYTLRACVGNLRSSESVFTPVSFASCLSSSASAEHTRNSAEELDGTTVSANVSVSLPSIIAELADVTVDGTFVNADDVVRSSFALTDVVSGGNSVQMTNSDGWPYLPQGKYALNVEAICTLPGGRTLTAESSMSDIPVPAPDFEVNVSAYTSYDKARNGDLDFANNHDNKYTVFERKASVTISDRLLANSNYSKTSSVKFNSNEIGTFDVNTKDFGNDAGCSSWQNYPFSADMTFDGVYRNASCDCHITGLPYSFNFYKNESGLNSSAWNKSNITYTNNKCCISYNGKDGYLISPRFHCPSDIKVQNYTQAQAYKAGAGYNNCKIRIGVTPVDNSVAAVYSEYGMSSNTDTGERYETFSPVLTMSSGNPYVSLHHNDPDKPTLVAWAYICIYGFELQYGE